MTLQQHYHLNCRIFGRGTKKMIAFHGFGQESSVYDTLAAVLTDYTIYSVDLFFHGKSRWNDSSLLLTPTQWKHIMEDFLKEHHIDRFSVTGFSMGGRVALATVPLFAEQIEEIILIAPDGVKLNAWYRMATTLPPIRGLFRKMAYEENQHFERLVSFVQKYKLVDPGVIRMAEWHMGTPELRRRVYNTWTLYNLMNAEVKKVASLINKYRIPISIFVGRHDKIITATDMRRLTAYLDNFDFQILERGHYNLIGAVAEYYYSNKKKIRAQGRKTGK